MHLAWTVFVVFGVIVSALFLYVTIAILTAKASYLMADRGRRKGSGILFQFYRWDWDEDTLYMMWGAIWPAFWTIILPGAAFFAVLGRFNLHEWVRRDSEKKQAAKEEKKEEKRLAREAKKAPESLKKIEKELSNV